MGLLGKKRQPKHLKPIEIEEVRKPINFGIYFIIIFFVLVVALGLIGWDKLTVREVEIEGLNKVNYLEVVRLSDIKFMSNIYAVNLDDVKTNIEQYPVLKVLEVRRKLPDTIVIVVDEREPIAYIKTSDKQIVVNENLYALEISELGSYVDVMEVIGTEISDYELSYEVELTKDIQSNKLKLLLKALKDTQIDKYIETIDITFTENIKLMSKQGYEIQIGNSDNVENKCKWIKTMIPKLVEEQRIGGILYITNVNSAHYIASDDTE